MRMRYIVVSALLMAVVSSMRVFPHELAYFNELSGGPENGYRHLLHSNLDWEQDLLLIEQWIREHESSPEDVRFASYCPFPAESLIPDISCSAKNAKWEIVSSNKVMRRDSVWLDRLSHRNVRRIGYTAWVFPVE